MSDETFPEDRDADDELCEGCGDLYPDDELNSAGYCEDCEVAFRHE